MNESKPNREYEALPEAIKRSYTEKQWLWLSAKEKQNLVTTETEPEC